MDRDLKSKTQPHTNTSGLLPVPVEVIERRIYVIRGQKVMLDSDLAEPYQVPTKVFNQAVSRNSDRFPDDFRFRLSAEEAKALRSQIVTSSWGGRRYLPDVFTEHGVAMLSSVLRSKRAVQMNLFIIRVFVKLREMIATHKDLARKIEEIERKQQTGPADRRHNQAADRNPSQTKAPYRVCPSRRREEMTTGAMPYNEVSQ